MSTILNGHTANEDDNEYATPPKIWRPLSRAVDGFDVDPCSGAEDVPIADTRFTKADDGLSKAWHGAVFVNPPWSSTGDGSAKETWLAKCRNQAQRDEVEVVVVVLPADTSAHWWHDHMVRADALCLVGPGRIPFVGQSRNPSFSLAIAAFGLVDEALVEALDSLGAVMQHVDPVEQTTLPTDGTVKEWSDTERQPESTPDYCDNREFDGGR